MRPPASCPLTTFGITGRLGGGFRSVSAVTARHVALTAQPVAGTTAPYFTKLTFLTTNGTGPKPSLIWQQKVLARRPPQLRFQPRGCLGSPFIQERARPHWSPGPDRGCHVDKNFQCSVEFLAHPHVAGRSSSSYSCSSAERVGQEVAVSLRAVDAVKSGDACHINPAEQAFAFWRGFRRK